jgi:hypothetical protein
MPRFEAERVTRQMTVSQSGKKIVTAGTAPATISDAALNIAAYPQLYPTLL